MARKFLSISLFRKNWLIGSDRLPTRIRSTGLSFLWKIRLKPSILIPSFIAVHSFCDSNRLMRHFISGFQLSALVDFGLHPVSTRNDIRCSTVFVRPGPTWTLYIGFIGNPSFASGFFDCRSWSTDWICRSSFSIMLFAVFRRLGRFVPLITLYWMSCKPHSLYKWRLSLLGSGTFFGPFFLSLWRLILWTVVLVYKGTLQEPLHLWFCYGAQTCGSLLVLCLALSLCAVLDWFSIGV